MTNAELLKTFVAAYPAQPATAYWRAIEIGAIASHGLPEGLGLDLGCGDGILTDILLSATGPRQLVGIDPDPFEVEAARKFSFYQRLHVAPGDSIPEADASFDFVLSNSVLEHIPHLSPTIAEAARVLRPGGKFLFTVPAPPFRDNLSGPILPSVSRAQYLETLDRRIAHFNYLSGDQWKALAEAHGMRIDACLGYFDKPQTRRWETLSRMTGGLFYSVFGQKQRPIEIQRSLGLRALQNRARTPQVFANALSSLVDLGAPVDAHQDHWIESDTASCLLVTGRKL
ncbi:class I SAM-dependent methyltransferase [Rhodoblastus sp.]|uniref:class I SAM-dependent methyltransferase n=1 Tax=Rhodoblastus sp. TaxID=1962975 RepID=UPI003F9E32AE